MIKKMTVVVLIFSLVFVNYIPASAMELTDIIQSSDDLVQKVNDDEGNIYFIVTSIVENNEISIFSDPEKSKSVVYTQNIYDVEGDLITSYYVTVTGTYTEVESTSQITSITAVKHAGDTCTFSKSISGNTGVSYLTWYGLTFYQSYKLYSNGNMVVLGSGVN